MKSLLLAATAAMLIAVPASAAVLTFEGVPNTIYTAAINRSGYTIANGPTDEQHFHEIDSTAFPGFVVSNGTGVLYNDRDTTIVMTQVGGGRFTLGSFDASSTGANNGAVASLLSVSAFVNNVLTTSLNFAIGNSGFLSYNGSGLGSFDRLEFTANGQGGFQLDNVSLSPATGAVPEASTWAMLIAGFGLVGGVKRRRRLVAA